MDNNSRNLGQSLSESVADSGVTDVASDIAEMALDSSLDDGLLKDIPVFGWFVKTHGAVLTVRERILIKKIAGFLQGARSTTSNTDIQSFRLKVQNDSDYSREVGEKIVLLLDRHEDYEKSGILGRVFARHLMGLLTEDEFRRIARAIDICSSGDLVKIGQHYDQIEKYQKASKAPEESAGLFQNYLPLSVSHQLFTAGLVDEDGYVETTYKENAIGRILIDCLPTRT